MSEELEPADYVAAALIEISKQLSGGIAHRVDQLAELVYDRFDVRLPEEVINKAVRMLADWSIAYVSDDPLAGTLVRVSEERLNAFLLEVEAEQDEYKKLQKGSEFNIYSQRTEAEELYTPYWDVLRENPVLSRYFEFGLPFIEAAMPKLTSENVEARLAAGSDRIVQFSDNYEAVEEIREKLNELEEIVRRDNEVGDALGDRKDEALSELSDLQSAMARKNGRASYLLSLSQRFLNWLGRIVAKTSAETVVKNLTKLFVDWLL